MTGTSEPQRAVRRSAIESAADDLERALCRDRCHVVVVAPAGPGTTSLVAALGERLASSLRVVPLPTPPPAEDELCVQILEALGEPPGSDAESALVGVARQLASRGSALALVIGDVRAWPQPTLRRLGRLVALAKPGLRLALLAHADSGSQQGPIAEVMSVLGIGAVKVVLDARLEPGGAGLVATAPGRSAAATAERNRPAPLPHASLRVQGARRDVSARSVPLRRAMQGLALALALLGFHLLYEPAAPVAPERSREARAPRSRPVRAESPAAPAQQVPEPAAASSSAPAAAPRPKGQRKTQPPTLPEIAETAKIPEEPAAKPLDGPAEILGGPAAMPEGIPQAAAPAPQLAEDHAGDDPGAEDESPQPVADGGSAPAGIDATDEIAAPSDAPPIQVSVNADPWARVHVDGQDIGVTPMSDVELAPGLHRFRVEFPDGRVIERTLRVDALRAAFQFP